MVDWKALSLSSGYRSIKGAYIRSVSKRAPSRLREHQKQEALRRFNWIIGRALHYSHHTGKPLDLILLEWETARGSYTWEYYYQNFNIPKFTKHARTTKKPRACKRTKKPRWSKHRKNRQSKNL